MQSKSYTPALRQWMQAAPVIAVVVIDKVEDAVPMAEALVAGGVPVVEITLRTPAALGAIEAVRKNVPGAIVAAGTLLMPDDPKKALDAGAQFGVSPGSTEQLLDAVDACGLPMLPAAATASEAMRLAERGHELMKFFPAREAGGAAYLKSLSGPLPHLGWCPTGGISLSSAPEYLALKNILCVGGSWLAPREVIAAKDWATIEKNARAAAALKSA